MTDQQDEHNAVARLPFEPVVRLLKQAIDAEPEFPDPCFRLRDYIHQAVSSGDEKWILHMMRQAVKSTKAGILERARKLADAGEA